MTIGTGDAKLGTAFPTGPEASRRQAEILDAATELFAAQGYSDAVTQDLALRLQVGKGTIYRHYPSKRDLFLAAVDRAMLRLREHIDARIEGTSDPLERIALAVHAFLGFFEDHPDYVELLILERALFKDRTRPTYLEHRDRIAHRWQELLRGLIAEGRVRDIPADRITTVLGDLCYGTIFTNRYTGRDRPSGEQARDILDILFQGILGERERRPSPAG
ncbi:TetR/AcrR family transcriptional regulator [Isosphaeraceae bacterium EP7]